MHRVEVGLVAAAHHRQRATLRARLPARDRGIDHAHLLRTRQACELTRHIGRGGGVVNQVTASGHACQRPVLTQHHATQVVVVAHTYKHHVSLCRRQPRAVGLVQLARRHTCPFEFVHPSVGFGRGAVVHRDTVTSQRQMRRHGITHDA